MLYQPEIHAYLDASPLHHCGQLSHPRTDAPSSSAFDGPLLSELVVGQSRYPLRSPRREHAGPDTYCLEGFWPLFIGHGNSVEAAKEDFEFQVHSRFQELVGKPDFDRNEAEDRAWNHLGALIDLSRYDQLRFTTSAEIGHVVKNLPPRARLVQWASGQKERIDVYQAHPKFAALAIGRWFEAVVRRRYLTEEFLELEHVNPISDPWFSGEDRRKFWGRLSDKG